MEEFLTAVEKHKETFASIFLAVIVLIMVIGDAIAKVRKGDD